ncbi:hypothetical protein [Armatimonas sp.]|uniref:hypothetical protein n=1 Tax=Armatimonas sp. TaxID=1872638 RepID=UPI00286C1C2C|nr:hypothetical protein [Armatimonas sp.]
MSDEITFWGNLVSRLQGEIPAQTLEAYQRASLGVYEMLDHTEQKRLDIKLEGHHPWEVPSATQSEVLCFWNAYALQLLGDKFIEADYMVSPATRGYLPPVTANQVLSFYQQVEGWMSRARQAHSNPNYRLDVEVPAELPPWREVEPCPNAYLHGMLEAMRSLRDHAGVAMAFFEEAKSPEDKQESVGFARQLWAAAKSKAEYADNLWGGNPSQNLHEHIEEHAKEAIEQFYRLGQLLAMPALLDKESELKEKAPPPPTGVAPQAQAIPGPGEVGFDPWCLTDSSGLIRLKTDPEARKAIARLWKLDPDPKRTLAILNEVREAFKRGDIGDAKKKDSDDFVGYLFCCPWASIYVVLRPLTLDGISLQTGQQFFYDVSCAGMNIGRPFVRRIHVANFSDIDTTGYGDPDEAPEL